ncbi:hypothetical protein CASFOL_021709 [Castilleja foliolosa]|uniref:Jacalin-type lectin domain-containing protein n=1 Tax=Castilleja foliolosa TaxID=1961234 RepID=A0ABD3CXC4_9LAMI
MSNDDSNFIKIGPAGSQSGFTWDEKGHNQIVQIFISHYGEEINTIQFQYVENGHMLLSCKRGGDDGYNFSVVKLNYPSEHITWISGSSFNNCICSITFGTNNGQYGPFGKSNANGKEFKFQVGDKQFGGFYGTTDHKVIKSIGVYLKPIIPSSYNVQVLQYGLPGRTIRPLASSR